MSALSFIYHESEPVSRHGEEDIQASTISSPNLALETVTTSASPSDTTTIPIDANSEPPPDEDNEVGNEVTSQKLRVVVIMFSLCASVFVAAIDITIISPALPTIANHFQSASSYQWAASSYVLGSTASNPSWGNLSNIWGRKPIMLLALIFFFVGSLICALGATIAAFLGGRAIQGVGASGLLTLVNISISDMFSMRDRSFYFGMTSIVWALASGIGPILGGVFTEKLTFRWCFWINLPISGAVFVLLFLTMPQDNPGTPVWAGLKAIDWSGSLLIVGGTLMLLLGLNFGGVTFSWSSATVVNLIVFGIFAGFLFGLNEWKLVKYPVIPPRLFRQRSSIASFAVCFFHGVVLIGVAYYLPLYFQSVLGVGPLLSGVYLLPFIITNPIMAAATGLYIQKTGKYIPAMYLGLVMMVLGIGLFIDLDSNVNWAKIISYQVLAGAGIGMNYEGPLLALQASVHTTDVTSATATFGFTRMLSAAISAIIGGVVFQNQMLKESVTLALLGPEIATQLQGGEATVNVDIINKLPFEQQIIARGAYYRSLQTMWIMYAAIAGLTLFAGLFIGVHTLSKELQPPQIGLANFTDVNRQTLPERNQTAMGESATEGISI